MGLSVFGDAPASLVPFAESGGGDKFSPLEHVGANLLIRVVGPKEVTTGYGVKTAIECSEIVVITGKGEPVRFSDALIFSAAIVDQLRGRAGQVTVAKVVTYETKQGGKAPKLDAPDADAVKVAESILAAS